MSEVAPDSAKESAVEVASMPAWPAYPEYKESGVEWPKLAPRHWAIKRLRFAVSTNPTKSELKGHNPLTEVSFVPMEAVGEYGGLNLEGQKVLEDVAAGYTYFRDGDLLVAKITPCFENGKGALAANLLNGIGFGTTELHVVRPAEDQLDARFLFYLSISHPFRKFGEAEMYGAGGQKRIPEDFIKDFLAFIPSLEEQAAIASFLDRATAHIDDLIAKKQQLINLLQEKRTALISQAVTKGLDPGVPMKDSGVEWMGEIPAHWCEPIRMKYTSSLKGRLGWQGLKAEEYADEGPYVVSSAHFENHQIQWSLCPRVSVERYELDSNIQLQVGDVLLMKDGAAMGKLAFVDNLPGKACLNSHLLLFRPIRVHGAIKYVPKFLFYFMQTGLFQDYIKVNGTGSTFLGISQEAVGDYKIVLPDIAEQQGIVCYLDERLETLDSLMQKVVTGVSKLQEYRAAIISAAVTGKVDVRGG